MGNKRTIFPLFMVKFQFKNKQKCLVIFFRIQDVKSLWWFVCAESKTGTNLPLYKCNYELNVWELL